MSEHWKQAPGRPSESFPVHMRCLQVEDWPPVDREAWAAACRAAALLSEPGPAVALASKTRKKRIDEWGRYLSFLRDAGELDPQETPVQRLTHDRVGRYILSLRGRLRDSSVWFEINDLSYMAPLIAPGREWGWIRRHPALPTQAEIRAARKPIVAPDPHRLAFGALDCCRQAEQEAPSVPAAIRFRDGLILAFATWSALRRKNLAEIEIGRHLRIDGGCMRLVFEDSVKNGQTIDSVVPDFLAVPLQTYLARYRPILLNGRADLPFLWINRFGGQLDYATFYTLFDRMGRRTIGKRISVHATRYAYASAVLDADPRDAEVAGAGLAHRGTSSVNKFYDRSGTEGPSRAWLKIVGRMRGSA